jgi:hypothetical protein
MNLLMSLFKIFYAGTMSVYPNVGMYGSNIILSVQACHRLGTHLGWFNSTRPITPGPTNEQGSYVWHEDALTIVKNLAPIGQRLIKGK